VNGDLKEKLGESLCTEINAKISEYQSWLDSHQSDQTKDDYEKKQHELEQYIMPKLSSLSGGMPGGMSGGMPGGMSGGMPDFSNMGGNFSQPENEPKIEEID
jgi:L1 cell adhesion molecule like protein